MLLRRAAVFAVLMLAAQTALWAYKVTLKPGQGEGSVIVLDSEDPALQATDINQAAKGQFGKQGERLWFRFPFCPGSFTAPEGEFFCGWYMNEEGGTEIETGKFRDINADLVLIAKWGALEFPYYDGEVFMKCAVTNKSPREVKVIEIGNMMGDNLTIPASVKNKGKTYSVVEIADGVCNQKSNLTALTIPATVRRIGTEAFRDCRNLGTVTFEEGSQLSRMGRYAFRDCMSMQNH